MTNKLFKQTALASAVTCLCFSAHAIDFQISDQVTVKIGGALTVGTSIRMEAPDADVLGNLSSTRVGVSGAQLGGNAGGSDLNFEVNRPVSTVVKGVFDLEIRAQNFGVFARAKTWYDQELSNGSRAYGNIPNGFTQNTPLSDAGFDPSAKFRGTVLEETYLFGQFGDASGINANVRVGRQMVSWGTSQLIGGGVNIINPIDAPAQVRPGALAEETRVPVGMVYAKLATGSNWGLEGFVPYEFRSTVLNPCGTFYAAPNYAPTGCGYVAVLGGSGVNDPTGLSTGRYPKRGPDMYANDSGQWGLSANYRFDDANMDMRGYAMNYHSRTPVVRVTNANIAGGYGALGATLTRLIDPNGIKYAMVYPEDIQLIGVSVNAAINPSLQTYGELVVRPNQPISLNASDLIAAFLTRSPVAALNLAKGVIAIPPGGSFDGYDRFRVSTLTVGSTKSWKDIAGASRVVLLGEVGLSNVAGLPDAGVLRYGRSDDYGVAAVTGGAACVDTTPSQKSCALDGFVTSNAWGYRFRLSASYAGLIGGATLTPSITFAQDVSGYSHDGTFVEGRQALRPAIRADWGKQYFAEMQYSKLWGGRYNAQIDRDTLTMSAGMRF